MSGRRKRNSKSSQIKGLPWMLKKKWGSMVIGYKGILHFGNSAWKSGKISLGGSKDRNIAKHESHAYQTTCSTPFHMVSKGLESNERYETLARISPKWRNGAGGWFLQIWGGEDVTVGKGSVDTQKMSST